MKTARFYGQQDIRIEELPDPLWRRPNTRYKWTVLCLCSREAGAWKATKAFKQRLPD